MCIRDRRTLKLVTITVCTARPGIIIGKGGQEVDKLKEELKKVTDKDIQINIFEVKRPELDAVIVANNIARQVEGKIAYRRAIKMAIANTMRMGAEGIKIQISGRLNGAETVSYTHLDVYKRQQLIFVKFIRNNQVDVVSLLISLLRSVRLMKTSKKVDCSLSMK